MHDRANLSGGDGQGEILGIRLFVYTIPRHLTGPGVAPAVTTTCAWPWVLVVALGATGEEGGLILALSQAKQRMEEQLAVKRLDEAASSLSEIKLLRARLDKLRAAQDEEAEMEATLRKALNEAFPTLPSRITPDSSPHTPGMPVLPLDLVRDDLGPASVRLSQTNNFHATTSSAQQGVQVAAPAPLPAAPVERRERAERLSDRVPATIATFGGEGTHAVKSVRVFCDQVEQSLFAVVGHNFQQMSNLVFSNCLHGHAGAWARMKFGVAGGGFEVPAWPELRRALLARFEDVPADVEKRLILGTISLGRSDTTSVIQYCRKFQQLIDELGDAPHPSQTLRFVAGLGKHVPHITDFIFREIAAHNDMPIDRAITQVLAYVERDRVVRQIQRDSQGSAGRTPRYRDDGDATGRGDGRDAAGRGSESRESVCWNCRQPGHRRRECTQPRPAASPARSAPAQRQSPARNSGPARVNTARPAPQAHGAEVDSSADHDTADLLDSTRGDSEAMMASLDSLGSVDDVSGAEAFMAALGDSPSVSPVHSEREASTSDGDSIPSLRTASDAPSSDGEALQVDPGQEFDLTAAYWAVSSDVDRTDRLREQFELVPTELQETAERWPFWHSWSFILDEAARAGCSMQDMMWIFKRQLSSYEAGQLREAFLTTFAPFVRSARYMYEDAHAGPICYATVDLEWWRLARLSHKPTTLKTAFSMFAFKKAVIQSHFIPTWADVDCGRAHFHTPDYGDVRIHNAPNGALSWRPGFGPFHAYLRVWPLPFGYPDDTGRIVIPTDWLPASIRVFRPMRSRTREQALVDAIRSYPDIPPTSFGRGFWRALDLRNAALEQAQATGTVEPLSPRPNPVANNPFQSRQDSVWSDVYMATRYPEPEFYNGLRPQPTWEARFHSTFNRQISLSLGSEEGMAGWPRLMQHTHSRIWLAQFDLGSHAAEFAEAMAADVAVSRPSTKITTPCDLDGTLVDAFVDCGCSVSFIDATLAGTLGLHVRVPPGDRRVQLMAKTPAVQAHGRTVIALLRNGDKVLRDVPLWVMDLGCREPLVIGRDLFAPLGFSVVGVPFTPPVPTVSMMNACRSCSHCG